MAYLADFKFLEEATSATESNIFYTKSDGEEIATDVVELNSKVEMYKQKVVRDGDTTFLAVDNTDYQWSTSQDDLVVTLPTPTDLTRTHIINLNFIAGSDSPITLFGDYNTPIDWDDWVEGCLYQIEFKYIETDWEIKTYCPDESYNFTSDIMAQINASTDTLADISYTAGAGLIPRANSIGKLDSGYLAISNDAEFATGTSTTMIPSVAQVVTALATKQDAIQTMTQTEYNALSTTEQNAIIAFIVEG